MLIIVEDHYYIATELKLVRKKISCQCHTELSATSVGKSLSSRLLVLMFFLKRMTSPSRSSFSSFLHPTYQTSHSHSGKLISTVRLCLIFTLTIQAGAQSRVLEFSNLSLRCSLLAMFKSRAWLSSVEVRAYFVLIKQLCHMIIWLIITV